MKVQMLNHRRQMEYLRQHNGAPLAQVLSSPGGPDMALAEKLQNVLSVYLNAGHCYALSSVTAALEVALRALAFLTTGRPQLTPEHRIVTSSLAFPWTVRAILQAGGTPVLVDVEPGTLTPDPELIREAILQHKAMAVLHHDACGFAGTADVISETARELSCFVVEDASLSLGAWCKRRAAGTFGDVGTVALFPSRDVETEPNGAVICTSNNRLSITLRDLLMRRKSPLRHLRIEPLGASVMLSKMPHVDDFTNRRRTIARLYCELLREVPLIGLPLVPADESHTHMCFPVRVPADLRSAVMRALRAQDVETSLLWTTPLNRDAELRTRSIVHSDLTNASRITRELLFLPMDPLMTVQEVLHVTRSLANALTELSTSLVPSASKQKETRKRTAWVA